MAELDCLEGVLRNQSPEPLPRGLAGTPSKEMLDVSPEGHRVLLHRITLEARNITISKQGFFYT